MFNFEDILSQNLNEASGVESQIKSLAGLCGVGVDLAERYFAESVEVEYQAVVGIVFCNSAFEY